jgi:hypothetical protein
MHAQAEQAQLAKDEDRRTIQDLEQRATEALASKETAERALAFSNEELRKTRAAGAVADKRALHLEAELHRAGEANQHAEQALRQARVELARERNAREAAESAYEKDRRELVGRAVISERAQQTLEETIERLTREHAGEIASLSAQQAKLPPALPRRPSSVAKKGASKIIFPRATPTLNKIPAARSAMRRRCWDIRRNPDDYELDLVQLCRAL